MTPLGHISLSLTDRENPSSKLRNSPVCFLSLLPGPRTTDVYETRLSGEIYRVRHVSCTEKKEVPSLYCFVTSCGEVRRGEQAKQLLVRHFGIADEGYRCPHYLPQVVRRDVRGHTDGDARGAVDEQYLPSWGGICVAVVNVEGKKGMRNKKHAITRRGSGLPRVNKLRAGVVQAFKKRCLQASTSVAKHL